MASVSYHLGGGAFLHAVQDDWTIDPNGQVVKSPSQVIPHEALHSPVSVEPSLFGGTQEMAALRFGEV